MAESCQFSNKYNKVAPELFAVVLQLLQAHMIARYRSRIADDSDLLVRGVCGYVTR